MNAREWWNRGRASLDPFDAFSNYWRGFNYLFSRYKGASEREKIARLLRARVSEVDAQEALRVCAAEVVVLVSRRVIDMRGGGRDTGTDIRKYRNAPTAQASLEAVFMVVYQVRCNLEHGQKSPSDARDRQLTVVAGKLVGQVLAFIA